MAMFDDLILVVSYLLGSFSGSMLMGRFRGVDIRTQGSGNAGGTNAFRTQGFKFALGVVAIDIGKGALATYIAMRYSASESASALPFAALLCAVLGHIWPVFHGLRGGKGAATLVGGLLVLWPASFLMLLATWVLCLTITGYVGLSTVLATFSLVLFAVHTQAPLPAMIFSIAMALLMLFTHRSNILRLVQKTEHRFDKVMLWRRVWRAIVEKTA